MSNKRKLRPAAGNAFLRRAIKIARRSRQETAINRNAQLSKLAEATANICRCGRSFAKGFKWCCVACSREQGKHTTHCNKRNVATV
jgi:hypothetical protein